MLRHHWRGTAWIKVEFTVFFWVAQHLVPVDRQHPTRNAYIVRNMRGDVGDSLLEHTSEGSRAYGDLRGYSNPPIHHATYTLAARLLKRRFSVAVAVPAASLPARAASSSAGVSRFAFRSPLPVNTSGNAPVRAARNWSRPGRK